MNTILVVEDEIELNQMVRDYLEHQGYRAVSATDGPEALRRVFAAPPDLVVLDLNLPGLDGIDVARTIRSQTAVPLILLTARGEEEDRLAGFDAGADDYVVKPFSLPELSMRIAAVLRRSAGAGRVPVAGIGGDDPAEAPLVVGDLVVDRIRRAIHVAGRDISPTAAQFAILERMASAPGRVFTRLQLLESFQQDAFEGYERTIDVHIKNIRKLIEADPRAPRRIVTVWGVGYRLEAPS